MIELLPEAGKSSFCGRFLALLHDAGLRVDHTVVPCLTSASRRRRIPATASCWTQRRRADVVHVVRRSRFCSRLRRPGPIHHKGHNCAALDIVCSVLTQTSLSTQPRPVAGNVTLPAFAAARRAAVRLLLTAERTAANPPQRRAADEWTGTDAQEVLRSLRGISMPFSTDLVAR